MLNNTAPTALIIETDQEEIKPKNGRLDVTEGAPDQPKTSGSVRAIFDIRQRRLGQAAVPSTPPMAWPRWPGCPQACAGFCGDDRGRAALRQGHRITRFRRRGRILPPKRERSFEIDNPFLPPHSPVGADRSLPGGAQSSRAWRRASSRSARDSVRLRVDRRQPDTHTTVPRSDQFVQTPYTVIEIAAR